MKKGRNNRVFKQRNLIFIMGKLIDIKKILNELSFVIISITYNSFLNMY